MKNKLIRHHNSHHPVKHCRNHQIAYGSGSIFVTGQEVAELQIFRVIVKVTEGPLQVRKECKCLKKGRYFFTIKTDPVEESKNKTIEDVKPTNGSVNKFFICLLECV